MKKTILILSFCFCSATIFAQKGKVPAQPKAELPPIPDTIAWKLEGKLVAFKSMTYWLERISEAMHRDSAYLGNSHYEVGIIDTARANISVYASLLKQISAFIENNGTFSVPSDSLKFKHR